MRQAIVFGKGGHARALLAIQPPGLEPIHVVASLRDGESGLDEGAYFETLERYRSLPTFLAIGDDKERRRVFEKLVAAGVTPSSAISERAWIAPGAVLGPGVFMGPFSMAGAQARIGGNVIVNTKASIDHDCVVGDHAQLAAGVTLGGWTEVGAGAFLDLAVTTLPRVRIGEGAKVLAGSVVVRDVEPHILVGGNPARPIRRL